VVGAGPQTPGWTLEPWLVASLALSLALYAIGWRRLAARSGPGRTLLRRRALAFGAGWLALVVAAASPLHQGGQRSFTLHMIEHELLMLVAAPLLVLSRPLGAMLWAFPAAGRRALGDLARRPWLRAPWLAFSAPVTATLVQAAVLWLWHAPGLFDLALAYEPWHIAQHLSFLVSALFFWQAMLRPRGVGLAALCLFATSIVAGALGALMAFSESPWYAPYALLGMAPFGLTPAEDQQLAGLLMWIPGGLVHAGAALAMIGLALRSQPAGPSQASNDDRQALRPAPAEPRPARRFGAPGRHFSRP
jgi:cytochrome c oxidase assembly factor CtaG